MKTVSDETILDCVRQGAYVGVWSRVVKGHGFRTMVEVVDSEGCGHVVYTSPYSGNSDNASCAEADCERVRRLLEERLGISRARVRIETAQSVAAASEAQAKTSVVRDDCGRIVRIVYRPRRIVRGAANLVLILLFFGLMGWLVWTKGHSREFMLAVFPVILALAITPSLYDFFGRREFVIGKGTGHYFNGVGRVGLTRPFVFNETTRVHKGESNYYQSDQSIGHKNTTGTRNMTRIPEVQLFTAGNPAPARRCAHDDEALIDVFVKLLREAIRSRLSGATVAEDRERTC